MLPSNPKQQIWHTDVKTSQKDYITSLEKFHCDRSLTREASVDRGTHSYVRQHLRTTMNRPQLRPNNKAEQGTAHYSKHSSPFPNGVPNSKVHTATRTFDTSFNQSCNHTINSYKQSHHTRASSHTIHMQGSQVWMIDCSLERRTTFGEHVATCSSIDRRPSSEWSITPTYNKWVLDHAWDIYVIHHLVQDEKWCAISRKPRWLYTWASVWKYSARKSIHLG